jgi:hypothetical protein
MAIEAEQSDSRPLGTWRPWSAARWRGIFIIGVAALAWCNRHVRTARI